MVIVRSPVSLLFFKIFSVLSSSLLKIPSASVKRRRKKVLGESYTTYTCYTLSILPQLILIPSWKAIFLFLSCSHRHTKALLNFCLAAFRENPNMEGLALNSGIFMASANSKNARRLFRRKEKLSKVSHSKEETRPRKKRENA